MEATLRERKVFTAEAHTHSGNWVTVRFAAANAANVYKEFGYQNIRNVRDTGEKKAVLMPKGFKAVVID